MIIIISFILDGLVSTKISSASYFYPLFTLVSLLLTYKNFNQKDNYYYLISALVGLIYDIVYTDTLFLNAFIFFLISFITRKIFSKYNYNLFSLILVSIITIIYYRIITYLILCLINYLSFDIFILLKGIYKSLLINAVYVVLIYGFIKRKKVNN